MPVQWIAGDPVFANSFISGEILIDAGVTPMAVSKYRDRIKKIVLTHCHFDHIAHAQEIAQMCGARVYIHEADAPGLSDDTRNLSMHFAAHSPGIVPYQVIHDGDRIDGFLVVHTPGHTPGSICLYDGDNKDLISGDTVFTDGGFGRFDFPGGSLAALTRSLSRLSELEVNGLFPGHGEPVRERGSRHIQAACELIQMTGI